MKRMTLAIIIGAAAALSLGCQGPKFTRDNWEFLSEGVDDKFDVEQRLGEPAQKDADLWYYVDDDRNIYARIYFDEQDVVTHKEFMDGNTAEWLGSNPNIDAEPPGDVIYRGTKTRTIDQD